MTEPKSANSVRALTRTDAKTNARLAATLTRALEKRAALLRQLGGTPVAPGTPARRAELRRATARVEAVLRELAVREPPEGADLRGDLAA